MTPRSQPAPACLRSTLRAACLPDCQSNYARLGRAVLRQCTAPGGPAPRHHGLTHTDPFCAPILLCACCRASDSDTTDEILQAALEHAKDMKLCRPGDCVVALHRIGNASGERRGGLGLAWVGLGWRRHQKRMCPAAAGGFRGRQPGVRALGPILMPACLPSYLQ